MHMTLGCAMLPCCVAPASMCCRVAVGLQYRLLLSIKLDRYHQELLLPYCCPRVLAWADAPQRLP